MLAAYASAAVAAPVKPIYITVPSDVTSLAKQAIQVAPPAAATDVLTVDLILAQKNRAGAAEYARRVSTPGDPLQGRYLTPAQFGDMFGASPADYAAVIAWAQRSGLSINERSVSRTVLSVAGEASRIEAAFHVRLGYFKDAQGGFPAALTVPSVPPDIAARLSAIVGLSKRVRFAPLVQRRQIESHEPHIGGVKPSRSGGTARNGAYLPADLKTAYSIPAPAAAGPRETLAVFEQGGFTPSDVQQFLTLAKLSPVALHVRSVNGYSGAVNNANVELESVLDIDELIGTNPGAAQILVYEDGDDYFVALLDSLTAIANDDAAAIVSISYGVDEGQAGAARIAAEGALFVQLAAQGQAVFAASGDRGAYGHAGVGLNATDPGAQPFVTSVGGTTLYTRADQSYAGEEVWNDLGLGYGATGGGVSAFWPLPKYQMLPQTLPPHSVAYPQGSDVARNFPDVAVVGNPLTGAAVYSALNGGWLQVGGTSLAAPVYAGFVSLYDQLAQVAGLGHVGFYNPALYRIGTSVATYSALHDVRDGSNGNVSLYGIAGYSAGYGFDDASGWGSPDGVSLMETLLSNAIPNTRPPAAATKIVGSMTGNNATVSWTAGPGAFGYTVLAYDANRGLLVDERATTGTCVLFSGLQGPTFYAFYVRSLSPTGLTDAPPIYLQAAASSPSPVPVLLDRRTRS